MLERFRKSPKKGLLLSGLFALAILGYIIFDGILPKFVSLSTESAPGAVTRTETEGVEVFSDTDSDRDGLADWKEKLYRTDMYGGDTDGDGTSDGEEVLTGRDPLTPGPNDRLSFLAGLEATTTSIDEARRRFLEEYLREASQQIQEEAFTDVVSRFDPSKLEPRYELADLRTTADTATTTDRIYGNAFGALIVKYTSTEFPSEDDIIRELSTVRGDTERASSILKRLDAPAATYRNFASDLYRTAVPSDLARYHLLIVNGYDMMSRSLLDLRAMYENPVQAAGAYQVYLKAKYDVTVGYAGIVNGFIKKGVFFAPTEPGAPFTWTPNGIKRAGEE